MKKILLFLSVTLFLIDCSSYDSQPDDGKIAPTGEIAFSKGVFVNGAHPTSGVTSVNSEKTTLKFSKFKTDAGPKLLVYLTTAVGLMIMSL